MVALTKIVMYKYHLILCLFSICIVLRKDSSITISSNKRNKNSASHGIKESHLVFDFPMMEHLKLQLHI